VSRPGAADTIFALSSGALPAGIAVVRISGAEAGAVLERLAGRLPQPRRAGLVRLTGGGGLLLDRAMALWLPGPGSATGEDMAELHLHGGRATVAAVLAELGQQPGLRLARPGEFTRRAVEHGRLDLAEAEGLADLLAAETEGQRRAALRMAEGGLGRLIGGWQARLLGLSAKVEAAIEFAEDHDDVVADPRIGADVRLLVAEMLARLAEPPAERLRDGLRVLIAGPVNAGKSTLMNALAGRDVAIALAQEGTTRDLIEAPIMLDGLPLILIDSAGLRETADEAERIGVARARDAQAQADLILWLGPPDEAPAGEVIRLGAMADKGDIAQRRVDLAVSALTGLNMDELRRWITDRAKRLLPAHDRVALNQRHRSALSEAVVALHHIDDRQDELIVAEQVRAAQHLLAGITGGGGVEAMLDALFSRFCVGK
jgi:tRNA modification GTPase